MVRSGVAWRDEERTEGVWSEGHAIPYMKLAGEAGFQIKLNVGTLSAPPAWFLQAHPEARLINQNGTFSTNTMSFWYPGLHPLLAEKADRLFRELVRYPEIVSHLVFVDPDFGPASEPIYPAAWTMGPGYHEGETFWCYDENAQADFGAKMQLKYGGIAAANTQWQTSYADWKQVRIPRPGTHPGRMWEDVLTWYRDAKRDFILWQIGNIRAAADRYIHRPLPMILYVPGSDYSEDDWRQAVASGAGNSRIALMCDSKFLLQTARQTGCWLQYTGCENDAEVRHLQTLLRADSAGTIPMWGENAGIARAADDPMQLAGVVLENGLYGLDYTHSHFLFQDDTITPNAVFPKLQSAFAEIARK